MLCIHGFAFGSPRFLWPSFGEYITGSENDHVGGKALFSAQETRERISPSKAESKVINVWQIQSLQGQHCFGSFCLNSEAVHFINKKREISDEGTNIVDENSYQLEISNDVTLRFGRQLLFSLGLVWRYFSQKDFSINNQNISSKRFRDSGNVIYPRLSLYSKRKGNVASLYYEHGGAHTRDLSLQSGQERIKVGTQKVYVPQIFGVYLERPILISGLAPTFYVDLTRLHILGRSKIEDKNDLEDDYLQLLFGVKYAADTYLVSASYKYKSISYKHSELQTIDSQPQHRLEGKLAVPGETLDFYTSLAYTYASRKQTGLRYNLDSRSDGIVFGFGMSKDI